MYLSKFKRFNKCVLVEFDGHQSPCGLHNFASSIFEIKMRNEEEVKR